MSQTSSITPRPHLQSIARGFKAAGLRSIGNLLLRLATPSTHTKAGDALRTNRVAPQVEPTSAPAFSLEQDIPRGEEIKGEALVFNLLQVLSEQKDAPVPRDDDANQAFLDSFIANCGDDPGYTRFHVAVQSECVIMKQEDGSLSAYIKPPYGENELNEFLESQGFDPFQSVVIPPHEERYFNQ